MVKPTQQMDASQPRTKSQPLLKCPPQLQERGTILYWHDQLLNKILTKIN